VVSKEGTQRFGAVAGDQSLATIMILLPRIRNALAEHKLQNLAQGIQNLIERRNIDNVPEYVISTETYYPFFQDRILKFAEPDLPVEPMREEESLQIAYNQLTLL